MTSRSRSWRAPQQPSARPVAGITRRKVLLTGVAGLATLALPSCGDEAEQAAPATPEETADGPVTLAPDGTQEITLLVRDDYVFYPDAFTITPGHVRLTLTSEAEQLTHNIRFTPGAGPAPIEEEIPIVAPGDSDSIEFAVDQPGDYRYECSFHVALGQVGTMTVTAA